MLRVVPLELFDRRRAFARIRQRLVKLILFTCALPVLANSIPRAGTGPARQQPQPPAQQAPAAAPAAGAPQPGPAFVVTVADENNVAVQAARVTLTPAGTGAVSKCETDFAGRCQFSELPAGVYQVRVEKEGFYAVHVDSVRPAETPNLDITLPHQQEYRETVRVTESPPAIDPEQTAATETLKSQEIISLPYSTTRDIRNIFAFLPGVLSEPTGQVHLDGSASSEIFTRLDGFNVSQPLTGLLDLRVSADAVRSIAVQGSRTSAEFGKGSGGALSLETGMGDDHYRFSATDFLPSFQNRKGVHIEALTPRATFSGPIRRGKAWFYDAGDGEYDLTIIKELPSGADQAPLWRFSNLAKAQVNLASTNSLIASFLTNRLRADRAGLTAFSPLETTTDQTQTAYLASVKDEAYLPRGMLLETGFAFSHFGNEFRPRGDLPYVITPEATSGNFFETSEGHARRWQGIAQLYLPSRQWRGRHQLEFGADLDRITDQQSLSRGTIVILREDGTTAREAAFTAIPSFGKNNFEASGYAQDRWSLTNRWLVEGGLRLDWDEIVARALWSPRLASTYLLTSNGETKLSVGIGLVYDPTQLELLTRALQGMRCDYFSPPAGFTPTCLPPPAPPPVVISTFQADEAHLDAPRFLNFSAAVERKLPAAVYLKVEYIGKRGANRFDYENVGPASGGLPSGLFALANHRADHYDAVTFTLRHTFRNNYTLFGAYTRSKARSNAVLDPSLDNLLFGPQAGGRLPWDAPNRLISWGWLPLVKKFTLAYTLDWHTGGLFSVVNENQQLVGVPDSLRFPDFFSLNLHIERRFRFFGFQWAIRGGFDDITGRENPTVVINNIDSPKFLTFSGVRGGSFTGRIRFLGRK